MPSGVRRFYVLCGLIALLPLLGSSTAHGQVGPDVQSAALARLEDWASACRAVPGLRVQWLVEVNVSDGPGGPSIGATYHRQKATYLWPVGLHWSESVVGGRGVTEKFLEAANLTMSKAEVIALDSTHVEAKPLGTFEPSQASRLDSEQRLFEIAANAPSLLGCWIADRTPKDIIVEEFSPHRLVARLTTPPIRFELEGTAVSEYRLARLEQLHGKELTAAYSYSGFRPVPLYPGLVGFARTATFYFPESFVTTADHRLESFEVVTDLGEADFVVPTPSVPFMPARPAPPDGLPRHASTENTPSPVLTAPPPPPPEPQSNWRVVAGVSVVAAALLFFVYRRFAVR